MKRLYSKQEQKNNISNVIKKIIEIGKDKVRFVILYGSVLDGRFTDLSDIDVAVFYEGDHKERFDFRVKILGRVDDKFDIQIFQDLPLYIQKEILSTGNVIYFRDYKEVFDIFMRTIREFEDFKPRLELYYSKLGV